MKISRRTRAAAYPQGRIIPDLIVKYPETTDMVLDLRRKSLDFNSP